MTKKNITDEKFIQYKELMTHPDSRISQLYRQLEEIALNEFRNKQVDLVTLFKNGVAPAIIRQASIDAMHGNQVRDLYKEIATRLGEALESTTPARELTVIARYCSTKAKSYEDDRMERTVCFSLHHKLAGILAMYGVAV